MTPHKPERRVSLQETMRRMTQRMDTILDEQSQGDAAADDRISKELRAWITVDPLLAHLHKQLLDARASHKNLAARHGAKDVMTSVARDMVDSAQCAVDTRLIELRRNEETKAAVAAMIRAAQDEEESERVSLQRRKSKAFWRDLSAPPARRPSEKDALDSALMVIISLAILQRSLMQATETLSMVSAFGHASNDDRQFSRLAGSA